MAQEINKQLDDLFERWKGQMSQEDKEKFCCDGLMYGDLKKPVNKIWYRAKGNEEVDWQNASKRVMFLLKESNKGGYDSDGNGNTDFRTWSLRDNYKEYITHGIYKNIALWLYGLLNIDKDGNAPTFDLIDKPEIYTPFIDKTPFAYVNCKKTAGGEKTDPNQLSEFIDRYKDFIREQILILTPDIIVCGVGRSVFQNFVKPLYPDLTSAPKESNWMYYSEEAKKLIIDSYHPSYWRISPKEMYTEMMDDYKLFLDKYPDFRQSCRK